MGCVQTIRQFLFYIQNLFYWQCIRKNLLQSMHTDTKYCYSNNYHTITQENTKKTLWNLDNAIIKKTEIAVKN